MEINSEFPLFKDLFVKFTENYEILQTEVYLLNKLLFCEQKFSNHLNTVFVLYEEVLYNSQQNDHNFNATNQLEEQKSIAKQNETEVKKLRQELKTWRQNNHRLNDINHSEEISSNLITLNEDFSQIKSERTQTESSSETQNINLDQEVSHQNEDYNQESNENNNLVQIIRDRTSKLMNTSSNTDTNLIEENIVFDKNQNISISELSNVKLNSSETSVSEDNNELIQNNSSITENEESIPGSSESSQAFLFVSEYLSKNQNSNQLKDKNKKNSLSNSKTKSSNERKDKKYSKIDDNLKELIIKNMNNGITGTDVGKLFDVKPDSCRAIYRRYLLTGQFTNQKKGCRPQKLNSEQKKQIFEWFEQNSTLTLKELKAKCVEKWPQLDDVSLITISRAVRGFPTSDNTHHKHEILFRRRQFLRRQTINRK